MPLGSYAAAAVGRYAAHGRRLLARGRPPRRAVPERARRAAHPPGSRLRAAPYAQARRPRGPGERPHLPPQLRHASRRGRRRPAQRAGDARPHRHRHHPDLHARHRRAPARGVLQHAPAGAAARVPGRGADAADGAGGAGGRASDQGLRVRARRRRRRRGARRRRLRRPRLGHAAPRARAQRRRAAQPRRASGSARSSACRWERRARGDLRPPARARRRQGHDHRPLGDDGPRARTAAFRPIPAAFPPR